MQHLDQRRHAVDARVFIRDSDRARVIVYTKECPGGRPLRPGTRVRFKLDPQQQGRLPLIALSVEYVKTK